MKSKSADKIKMPSIDELLGVSGEESATDIEISRIHSFANHPFKVLDDDKMDDLVGCYLEMSIAMAFTSLRKLEKIEYGYPLIFLLKWIAPDFQRIILEEYRCPGA